MKVIISAAGTGGHINPGIAIANKIKEHEPDSEIVFFGTERGLENDLVPRAGYQLKTIEAYGIQPKPSLSNLKNIIKTMNSRKVVKRFIDEFKPDVVIGTGGYICGPVFAAANAKKIPTFLHDLDLFLTYTFDAGSSPTIITASFGIIFFSFNISTSSLRFSFIFLASSFPSIISAINMLPFDNTSFSFLVFLIN